MNLFCSMQQYKNIIFDLGGIFLNLDFKKTEQAFIDIGIHNFSQLYSQNHASDLFELLETGKITGEEFCEHLRMASGANATDEDIFKAWGAMLLHFPKERLDWLNEIKNKYAIYLFSNTNLPHYRIFSKMYDEQSSGKDFNSFFIKAYYSHEMGLRKPYPESFIYILNEQKLDASETLFIDDTLKNIEGAKLAGLHTLHIVSPATVMDYGL